MSTKIIIISNSEIDTMPLAKMLVEKNDDLSIASTFTTDTDFEGEITDDYQYYMSVTDLNLACKNNAILFVETKNFVSKGMTIDEMYNNNIFCMKFNNFNDITDHVLLNQDIIVIWVDSSKHMENYQNDLREIPYIEDRLEYIPYIYFLDETLENMSDVILKYVNASETKRRAIIEENK